MVTCIGVLLPVPVLHLIPCFLHRPSQVDVVGIAVAGQEDHNVSDGIYLSSLVVLVLSDPLLCLEVSMGEFAYFLSETKQRLMRKLAWEVMLQPLKVLIL